MFIGLLLKAMKSDVNVKRVAAFAKRVMQVIRNCTLAVIFFPTKRLTSLFISSMRSTSCSKTVFQLQVALQQPPQYACGCLFLLSEVLKARPHLG